MTESQDWIIDPRLKQWATARQIEFIDAVNTAGSWMGGARACAADRANMGKTIKSLQKKAALAGYESDPRRTVVTVAEPYVVKGKSTYFDRTGAPTQEWVKTRLDDQKRLEMIKEAIDAFLTDVPKIPAAEPYAHRATDIIPWLEIGDAHLGMLAHEAETGENFDLKIAERELCAAIAMLFDEMAPCERLVVNDVGDFTHYENMDGVTEASRHMLDYDGRFPKMICAYSRIMRVIVTKALEKAQFVDVIVNQGNHSRTNDIWMAELLRVAYGHTGRVNVLNNDTVFIGYRMGATFVMTHHSDKCRPAKLAQVMATDFPKDWGESEYRYIDIGHLHHGFKMNEHPGVTIECWNTLAAKDNWAMQGGYRSRQSITIVNRSRTYGEVGRRLLPIRQVRDNILGALSAGAAKPYIPAERRAFAV